jgi:hypothetical protein
MPGTSIALSTPVLKKAIDRYYQELNEYKGKADYELAVRTAFLNLLAETARQVKWTLIPEQTIEGGLRPDGVLRDSFDLKRGFWEAKGPHSDLDKEIARKIATGYPLINTIFENTKRAVLFQNKKRAYEYDLQNSKAFTTAQRSIGNNRSFRRTAKIGELCLILVAEWIPL